MLGEFAFYLFITFLDQPNMASSIGNHDASNFRSSHPEVFFETHRKTPVPDSGILFKKRLCHRCFPVNFVKFPRTPFFIEHLW